MSGGSQLTKESECCSCTLLAMFQWCTELPCFSREQSEFSSMLHKVVFSRQNSEGVCHWCTTWSEFSGKQIELGSGVSGRGSVVLEVSVAQSVVGKVTVIKLLRYVTSYFFK